MTEKSFTTIDPTAEPRKRRKDARPGEIIEAALAEFAAHGFAGARLDDVARRAGVVKGTIYRYFPSKEALFIAVVHSRVNPVFGEMSDMVDAFQGSTRELLVMICRALHQRLLASDMPKMVRIMLGEGGSFPELAGQYHDATIAKGRMLIERVIQRGLARGEVRPGPAADLPLIIVAPAIMGAFWRTTFQHHAPLDGEQLLAAHIDLVCHGLLVHA